MVWVLRFMYANSTWKNRVAFICCSQIEVIFPFAHSDYVDCAVSTAARGFQTNDIALESGCVDAAFDERQRTQKRLVIGCIIVVKYIVCVFANIVQSHPSFPLPRTFCSPSLIAFCRHQGCCRGA